MRMAVLRELRGIASLMLALTLLACKPHTNPKTEAPIPIDAGAMPTERAYEIAVRFLREKEWMRSEHFDLQVLRCESERCWLLVFWFHPDAHNQPHVSVYDDGRVEGHHAK